MKLDFHSHILPGLDDGATDLENAVMLSSAMKSWGFERITCTPHINALYRNTPDKISRAYFYEKEAIKYSQTIKRTVFHNMPNLKLSEKFHLRYFALHIENLAKAAENVADQLAVMAIRRTL